MIRLAAFGLVFAAAAVGARIAAVRAAPRLVMSTAMERLEDRGLPAHRFTLAPRAAPDTQNIVRPSPDLAYSLCRFDLSGGPVRVAGGTWARYASLTVFDARTDVVFVTSLDEREDRPRGAVLALDRTDVETPPNGVPLVRLSAPKGLALIRRLAPSDALYAEAEAIRDADVCAPL